MIAVDATSSASFPTLTWSHTCSGSNRILIVGLKASGGVSDADVTYNGVSMTFVNSISNGPSDILNLYYLLNPASGSHTIDASAYGGTTFVKAAAASYTGAKQTEQLDNSGTKNNGGSTSYSHSLTVDLTNCWAIALTEAFVGTIVVDAGTTARKTNGVNLGLYDSNTSVNFGTATLSWTDSSNPGWQSVMIIIKATDSAKPQNSIFFGTNF